MPLPYFSTRCVICGSIPSQCGHTPSEDIEEEKNKDEERERQRQAPDRLQEFVDSRLVSILKWPNMWGTPAAVECQFLLLVEMWLTLKGASEEDVTSTAQRFYAYINADPPQSVMTLSDRLELTHSCSNLFVTILRGFLAVEQGRHEFTQQRTTG